MCKIGTKTPTCCSNTYISGICTKKQTAGCRDITSGNQIILEVLSQVLQIFFRILWKSKHSNTWVETWNLLEKNMNRWVFLALSFILLTKLFIFMYSGVLPVCVWNCLPVTVARKEEESQLKKAEVPYPPSDPDVLSQDDSWDINLPFRTSYIVRICRK